MKKNLQLLLVMIVSILTSSLSSFAYDFEVDGFRFNFSSIADRTCIISGHTSEVVGDLLFPETVEYRDQTIDVIGIGDNAFRGCENITSITIPKSIMWIGSYAFINCTSLKTVKLNNRINHIYEGTFWGCSSLTSIELPKSVNSILKSAFKGCESLKSLNLSHIDRIDPEAFMDCISLDSVNLNSQLAEIRNDVFYNCQQLQTLTIPGSVKEVSFMSHTNKTTSSFNVCSNLRTLTIEYSETPLIPFATNIHDSSNKLYEFCTWGGGVVSYLTNQLEDLYLDRKFEEKYRNEYLKPSDCKFNSLINLTLGEHISELQFNGNSLPKLTTIISYASTPPDNAFFSNSQYLNVLVKVPYSALDTYKNAPGWKNFWNIEGFEYSGIDEVINDNSSKPNETGRYNLNGQTVPEDYKGVVIVRFSDGTTKKIIK